jgi:hypothetical protein
MIRKEDDHMNKVLIAVCVALTIWVPTMVSAMHFLQPIKIGELSTKDGLHFSSHTALPSSLKNSYYDFGYDNDVIRIYFLNYANRRIGSIDNINNAVDYNLVGPVRIFKIPNYDNVRMYLIEGHGSDGGVTIDIIGVNKNGNFVKYADNERFRNLYNDKIFGPIGTNYSISVDTDTLILTCDTRSTSWQYLLKWDDEAQWFGVKYKHLDS